MGNRSPWIVGIRITVAGIPFRAIIIVVSREMGRSSSQRAVEGPVCLIVMGSNVARMDVAGLAVIVALTKCAKIPYAYPRRQLVVAIPMKAAAMEMCSIGVTMAI